MEEEEKEKSWDYFGHAIRFIIFCSATLLSLMTLGYMEKISRF